MKGRGAGARVLDISCLRLLDAYACVDRMYWRCASNWSLCVAAKDKGCLFTCFAVNTVNIVR